jgi:predicted DNA-binding transcriptional regulator YafY
MYSPTTRLLTLLEMLQSYRQMPGAEIARRLEVDLRTVRRYIVTLQDMGIPVEAERGPYGAYHLARGFKLPPMMFTDTEAVALMLGLRVIREYRFPVEVASVEGAAAKIERVMPETLLSQVRGLQEGVVFNVTPSPVRIEVGVLGLISESVVRRRRVFLHYQSFQGEDSEREFDPYGVVFNEGYWYAAGYCHLRQDLRTFRLDRISGLELRDAAFERPADFDPLTYVLRSITTIAAVDQVKVLLHTSMEVARAAIPAAMGMLEEVEGGVIFRRSATQLPWVAHLLIASNIPMEIIGPEVLRAQMREIAKRAAELAGEPSL